MTDTAHTSARELFDSNAETYDRVNTIMSLGIDARWRGWVVRHAVSVPGERVLDAFAGTGLVGLEAARRGAHVTLADVSPGMLAVATRRARKRGLHVDAVTIDLEAKPSDVPGAPFDAITMAFGARYLTEPVHVIRGLSMLLAGGGRFVLMDVVEPDDGIVSRLASLYFFRILPVIAGTLVGHRELYDRLTSSTHAMGRRERLLGLITAAGLEVTETAVMGGGLIVGVVARRAAGESEA